MAVVEAVCVCLRGTASSPILHPHLLLGHVCQHGPAVIGRQAGEHRQVPSPGGVGYGGLEVRGKRVFQAGHPTKRVQAGQRRTWREGWRALM